MTSVTILFWECSGAESIPKGSLWKCECMIICILLNLQSGVFAHIGIRFTENFCTCHVCEITTHTHCPSLLQHHHDAGAAFHRFFHSADHPRPSMRDRSFFTLSIKGSLIHPGFFRENVSALLNGKWLRHLSEAAARHWYLVLRVSMLMLARCTTLLIEGLPSNAVCRCRMTCTSLSPFTFSQQHGGPPTSKRFLPGPFSCFDAAVRVGE